MTKRYEVTDRFIAAEDAAALLYDPAETGLTFRESVVYEFGVIGDESALDHFVERTLVDAVSQEVATLGEEGATALSDALFVLDYGYKKGVLDLEKEAIEAHYHTRPVTDRGFTLETLRITRRVYVFGEGGRPENFIKDICNPAIHRWDILS